MIKDNWELLKDQFSIDYKSFPDRWACIAWICANQLHKHNMNEFQRMKLLQEEHDARQHSVGASDGFRGNQYMKVVSGEIHHQPNGSETRNKTRYVIAKELGVSPTTVGTARNQLEDSGQVSKLDTSQGADGKTYKRPEGKKEMA